MELSPQSKPNDMPHDILAWLSIIGLGITVITALISAAVRFQRVSGEVEKNRQAIESNATHVDRRMAAIEADMVRMETRIMRVMSHLAKRVDERN